MPKTRGGKASDPVEENEPVPGHSRQCENDLVPGISRICEESDSEQSCDETILDRDVEFEKCIAEQTARHKRELKRREKMFELKLQQQEELEALEKRFAERLLPTHNGNQPNVETKAQPNDLTPNQIAARKAINTALPKFRGEAEVWPLFISCFNSTTETCGFSQQENLKRLMDSLEGEALEVVRGRLVFPDAVPDIIQDLKNLFGRPGRLLKNLLQQVRKAQNPNEERLETFIGFGIKVKQLRDHLVASDLRDHLSNPMLVEELVEKLPPSYRREWVRFKRNNREPIVSVFCDYVQTVAEEAAEIAEYEEPRRPKRQQSPTYRSKIGSAKVYSHLHETVDRSNKEKRDCWMCEQPGHLLKECVKFKHMTLEEKLCAVERHNLCKKCLSRRCTGKCTMSCRIKGCRGQHHPLLHHVNESVQLQHVGRSNRSTVIYRTMPVTLHAGNNSVNVTAFIDEGSSATLMDTAVATKLQAKGPKEPLTISWTKNISRNEDESMYLNLRISSTDSPKKWPLAVRTVSELQLPKQRVIVSEVVKRYKHLMDVPVRDNGLETPTIIIGLDNIDLFTAIATRVGNPGEPVAVRSKLGWTVYGIEHRRRTYNVPVNLHNVVPRENRELYELLREQYRSDEMGGRSFDAPISSEEQRAMEILKTTTKRVGDRFETGLLWRKDVRAFPDSYPMAEKRMWQLDKRLSKKPDLKESVCKMIKDYQDKGYAHKLTEEELAKSHKDSVWYLPLSVVQNPKKPGKIRLVWDAAASVAGVSLNSHLMKGPDMLIPLPTIISKFRERPIAFGGDLKEMYHQLQICEQDKQAQRFLFGTDSSGNPQHYVMDVATFGATCSPCSAQFVKNLNAQEFAQRYPRAAAAIVNNHYVDDYFDSVNTIEEAIELARAVKMVHSRGGFHIRNWVSNSEEFLQVIGDRSAESSIHFMGEQETTGSRVLGVVWKPTEDVFCFGATPNQEMLKFATGEACPTKRVVLSFVMAQFDPVGLITPVTIRGKMLIQDLWRTGCDWDSTIDAQSLIKWKLWIGSMMTITSAQIPRSYFGDARSDQVKDIQLHVFTDASETAYGCVAYFRAVVQGEIRCALVMSRSKVAPIKPMSIPRLELQAAVLGTRLAQTVLNNHNLLITKRFFWTDARVVLSWIKSDQRRYKQYVGLRVGEILDSTNVEDWNWVPSKENAADVLTKWGQELKIGPDSIWVRGPQFLYEPEKNWPRLSEPELNTAEELRAHLLIHDVTVFGGVIDANRISKWTILVRTMACVIRFVANCRRKVKGDPLELLRATKRQGKVQMELRVPFKLVPLQQQEYEKAERVLVRTAQSERFVDELKVLMKNNDRASSEWIPIDRSSPLYKLSPMVDEDGIIRIEGRTERAEFLPFSLRFPIIMPDDHPITRLIVHHYHERSGHGYREAVKIKLRQLYHILHLDATVRKVSSACVWCKVHRNLPKVPRMAPLPVQRLTPGLRPFSFTGIDYLGPFDVTIGRRTEKRWIVLFTCFVVRAIHLEVAHELTMQSCLMAIRRFICRRGWPVEFFSDNGTNFQGASKQIINSIGAIEETCADQLTTARTKWTFNPPAAPHMGGVWERLVRSVKGVLKALDDGRRLTDEILLTSIVEAEDIINSRPLTTVTQPGSDEVVLTPNSFLRGVLERDDREAPLTNPKVAMRDIYERTQQLAELMWKKWVEEYAPTLNQRTKWFGESRRLEIGDLVYVVDGKHRKSWVRGIVEDVIKAGDGRIRQAWVRTNSGRFKRATTQLAVLEIE